MMCSYPDDGLVRLRSVTGNGGLKGGQLGMAGFEAWFVDACAFLTADDLGLDALSLPMLCRYDDEKDNLGTNVGQVF